MPGSVENQLWQFAVRTYRQPGVADACLALQDERNADVNMLLFCVWVGTARGALSAQEFDAALSFSSVWNTRVVAPQRAARRWMKSDGCGLTGDASGECLTLRESIKANELAAEKIQLRVLETTVPGETHVSLTASEQLTHAVTNLRRYCDAREITLDDWVVERLAQILAAGVSSADYTAIRASFAG